MKKKTNKKVTKKKVAKKKKIKQVVCPECGSKLVDAGSYKVECPNGCGEAMEEGYFEDELNEEDD